MTALAERRVNMLLAVADTDRDAAISQAEADAMPRGDGWPRSADARERKASPRGGTIGRRPAAMTATDGPGRATGPGAAPPMPDMMPAPGEPRA